MGGTGENAICFDGRIINDFAASLALSPNSVASYRKCLAYFFAYLSGNGIEKPDERHIAAYRDELIASGRKANTVYNYMAAVRAFFRWTRDKGLYDDIAAKVPVPHADQTPNCETLTAAQLRKLMNSIDRDTLQGMRDYAILALMLTAGLSALEISMANVEDITESGAGYVFHVRGGDGRTMEEVRVPPYAMDAVSGYLNARKDMNPDAPPGEFTPLFASVSDRNRGKNEHMPAGSISRVVKNALRNAGYDGRRLSARSLKVSAMRLALQNGERLEDVQKFARHKRIRTTFLYEGDA